MKVVMAGIAASVLPMGVSAADGESVEDGRQLGKAASSSIETTESDAAGEMALPQITPGPEMTLAEALDAALRQNLTIEATQLEIEKAEATLSIAWGAIFPMISGKMELLHRDHEDTFDLTGSMGDLLPPGFAGDTETVIMPLNDLKGSLQASMPLVNLPAWYNISLAKMGIPMAELTLASVRRQMLLAVSEAYYFALMSRELIDLHLATIETASQHLRVAQAKLDAGTGLRIDVIRAETDLDQGRQELLSAHLAFDKARDTIARLTGRDDLPLPVAAPPLTLPTESNAELTQKALKKLPEIAAKRHQVEMARTQLDAVWMQFLPTLSAAWQGSYQFTKPGDLGSTDRSRWMAIFTLSVPLYNQMRYGELDKVRAEIRQASLQVEDAEKDVSLKIRNAHRDYLTSLTSVEIAERRATLSKEALTLAEAAFEAGTGSSLDVTESRRTTSSANVDLASKRLQSQLALLRLLNAIGVDLVSTTR